MKHMLKISAFYLIGNPKSVTCGHPYLRKLFPFLQRTNFWLVCVFSILQFILGISFQWTASGPAGDNTQNVLNPVEVELNPKQEVKLFLSQVGEPVLVKTRFSEAVIFSVMFQTDTKHWTNWTKIKTIQNNAIQDIQHVLHLQVTIQQFQKWILSLIYMIFHDVLTKDLYQV